ncbi:hypothetical protein AVEN_228418-1 [Araneus ventricosus]|uniref:Uncharacterized protein n=1 Tax=Araneus ventricosus TaxID=182803 RepID=A0A4Y2S427_ARAVE|nr:hypothetical protein AVEN_228418-1 [Araneus ventricosus]
MVVEAFMPSVNQSIEMGIEEIRVQVAEPLNDGFLNFGIGYEMATCQRSEEMKITWCEIRAVVDVLGRPNLCSSRTSVPPSSNSLHQYHTCFRDIAFTSHKPACQNQLKALNCQEEKCFLFSIKKNYILHRNTDG